MCFILCGRLWLRLDASRLPLSLPWIIHGSWFLFWRKLIFSQFDFWKTYFVWLGIFVLPSTTVDMMFSGHWQSMKLIPFGGKRFAIFIPSSIVSICSFIHFYHSFHEHNYLNLTHLYYIRLVLHFFSSNSYLELCVQFLSWLESIKKCMILYVSFPDSGN